MLTQCSIVESSVHGMTESPIHALQGNGPSQLTGIAYKIIYFGWSGDVTFFSSLFAILNANVEAIMALMHWQLTGQRCAFFYYDFDTNPSFDITKGVIQYAGSGVDHSQISNSPYGPHSGGDNPQPSNVPPLCSSFPLDGYPVFQNNPGGLPFPGLNQVGKTLACTWRLYLSGYSAGFLAQIQTFYGNGLSPFIYPPINLPPVAMVVPPPDIGPPPPSGVVLKIPIPAYRLLTVPTFDEGDEYFIGSDNNVLNAP